MNPAGDPSSATQPEETPPVVPQLALFAAGMIISIGTLWAFRRGGQDFDVFHTAWRLVLEGEGPMIYYKSPDRFLYAPGFAWLFAPLGLLPRNAGLALWCLAKAAALGYLIQAFARHLGKDRLKTLAIAAGGALLVARPLLIDLQYGQVNLLILAATCWALFGFFAPSRESLLPFVRWFALGIAAVSKLFTLPLLLLPWISLFRGESRYLSRTRWAERMGGVLGVATILLAPAVTEGLRGAWRMLLDWGGALQAKGLPLESHNQSFIAFLHHWFSGEPTRTLAFGRTYDFGWALLSPAAIQALSAVWMIGAAVAIVLWLFKTDRVAPLSWITVAIGLLILPSHLIWKPYFVMTLPLAILLVKRFTHKLWVPMLFFAAFNLSGFDVVGTEWGARLEAGSLMLWMHVSLLAWVVWDSIRGNVCVQVK